MNRDGTHDETMSGEKSLFALLHRYLDARRAEGLAAGTLGYHELYLRHFLSWLLSRGIADVGRIAPADVEAYRLELTRHRYRRIKAESAPWKSLDPKTRAERLRIVCAFLRLLVKEHVLIADPSASCTIVFPKRHLPKALTEKEAARLLDAPDPRTPAGLRDRALLALLYSSGLRRAEAAALDAADVDLSSGTVFVRSGKGGKSRLAPLGQSAGEVLALYITKGRPKLLGRRRTTALFIALPRSNKPGERLSPSGISSIVLHASKTAHLGKRVMAHALRHSLATHLLRAGADIRHVQAILGHADVTATEIYTHVAIRDLARVHAQSHPRGRADRAPRTSRPARLDPRYPTT